MKKIVKNILTLSLTLAMIGSCCNLFAGNQEDEKAKAEKTEKQIKDDVKNEVKGLKNFKKCLKAGIFSQESIALLLKDNMLVQKVVKDKKTIAYNKEKENYKVSFKENVGQEDNQMYYVEATFGDYTMKTMLQATYKEGNYDEVNLLEAKSKVTRPDTKEEIAAKELKAAKEDALKDLEAYKNEKASVVNLNNDYATAQKSINDAKNKEEVAQIKEKTLASMKKKVTAAEEKIAAELAAADKAKVISEEEATAFVNSYANQLSTFVKNDANKEEVLSMFANNEVEVTVSTLSSGKKTESVANYLNKLSKISNGTYKNNAELNISVEGVDLLGEKAVVKVVQDFDGNGVYCDVTVKSIELVKENEKVSINKIEVLETKSCK